MAKMVATSGRGWTYGVEHELADWDTRRGWDGYDRDPEPNIVNSNGIAADPSLKSYPFGAEINTLPTDTPNQQADMLVKFLKKHTDATANWRCGMHVHIRVPGLAQSLPHLKRLARYILENKDVYQLIDPLPRENREQHSTETELREARRRYHWMRMSHFTVIPEKRVLKQQACTTLKDFFEAEVPRSKADRPLWHAQPRAAISLRQLLQTETIEFRHFPQTLNPNEVITAVEWCRDYLLAAFQGAPACALFAKTYAARSFPRLETIYTHWQNVRWLSTTITKNTRNVVERNIAKILEEDRSNEQQ